MDEEEYRPAIYKRMIRSWLFGVVGKVRILNRSKDHSYWRYEFITPAGQSVTINRSEFDYLD